MKTKVIQRNPHVRSLVVASSLAFALAFASAAHAEDPYIESLGTSGISTGYRMKGGISRVEVDFQLTETANSKQWRVFGSTSCENTLGTMFYYTGTGSGIGVGHTFRVRGVPNFASTDSTKNGDSQWLNDDLATANLNRYTLVTDLKNGKNQIISENKTYTKTFNASLFTGLVADLPLSLFARCNNTNATAFANSAMAKIYGVKIYENYDESSADNSAHLVHNFVPCLKDGETPCFKDLVGDGFIIGENVEAFAYGGEIPSYQDDGYVSTVSEIPGEYFYIDTGYKVKNSTRVELDCALASNMVGTTSWALFDAYNSARFRFYWPDDSTAALWCWVGTNKTTVSLGGSAFPPPTAAREVRRTFILDAANTLASVVTSGFTNSADSVSDTFVSYGSGGNSLKLASAYFVDNTLEKTLLAPLKIYGCRIYENNQLVRDFAPFVKYDYETGTATAGLLDGVTGSFVSGGVKTASSYGESTSLSYGGAIRGEQDAYIESNGTTGMDTGYRMKGGISRVEVDFKLTTAERTGAACVYGDYSVENKFRTFFYYTGSAGTVGSGHKFGNRIPSGSSWTQTDDKAWGGSADTVRHVASTDLKNRKNGINPYPSGATSSSDKVTTKSFSTDFTGYTNALPLSIFGGYSSYNTSTGVAAFNKLVRARIYSVRFYENYVEGGNNTPVRELVPYSRGGVVGFYDTVTGEIVKNDNAAAGAFTFGGAGSDHGNLNCYLKPGYATKITHGESQTKTLTAYAPGATSYKWFRDGQLIDDNGDGVADGADGVLPVKWARGGTKTDDGYLHTYQAVAVFNLYGVERESEPTPAASITSIYLGTTLLVR